MRTTRRTADRVPAAERLGDPDACREATLRLLERTRRTRSDLRRRLDEKGFSAAVIDETLDRLARVGLVDDVEYARAFLAGRRARRGAGMRLLERQLRARGVGAEEVATARERLEEEQGPVDDVEAARGVIAQAERRTRNLEPRVRRQRLYALLVRRGFDADAIRVALDVPDSSAD